MYGCESWTITKAEHRRIDAFELWYWRRLESLSDCKEMKPANPQGNQSWIFTESPDVEDEAPILWPSDAKSRLSGKDPDTGKDWRQEAKGMTEDEMVGWHHWFNGQEFEQAPGDGEGQGRLQAYCRPWSCKESEMTEWLINRSEQNEIKYEINNLKNNFKIVFKVIQHTSLYCFDYFGDFLLLIL